MRHQDTSSLLSRAFFILILSQCLVSCIASESSDPASTRSSDHSIVYGDDDRLDVYAHPDPALRTLTESSIVALVRPSRIDATDPQNIQFNVERLGESLELCEDQRFFDQPRIGSCSGTLIDDDLVLTAGHCMEDADECENRRAVFGVHYTAENELNTITQDHIYSCARILVTVDNGDLDFAIFQLDRPVVEPFQPAPLRRDDTPLPEGTEVTLIGFPSGIPAKIAQNGVVTRPREEVLDYFEATVDAFGGNSGSGVFNEEGQHVGILVRGEQDYRFNGQCTEVNTIEAGGPGSNSEDITYSTRAIEALCAQGYPSERLCQTEGDRSWCFTCDEDTDCRDGWTCNTWDDNPSVSFCAPGCGDDSDCRADHACSDAGVCEPRTEVVCSQGQPWTRDACGRLISNPRICSETERCVEGGCEPRRSGDACTDPIEIDPVDQVLEGEMSGAFTNDAVGSCAGNGPDIMFTFTLTEPQTLRASAEGFDSVLYVRSDCEDEASEVACNDDRNDDTRSAFIATALSEGTWTLVLDSYNNRTSDYTLQLDFGPTCEDYPCLAGDTECRDGETRSCFEDAQGCPAWSDWEACDGENTCIQDACVEIAAGDTCDNPIEIEPVSQFLDGAISNRTHRNTRRSFCGGSGAEVVHTFTLESEAQVTATSFGFDTVLYIRSDCSDPETEVACNDDNDPPGFRGSRVSETLPAGSWALVIDAYDDDEEGAWSIDLDIEYACSDTCEEGETRCAEGGVETCARARSGCFDWSGLEPCSEDQECRDGACVDPQGCEDICPQESASECTNAQSYRVCRRDANTQCLVWGEPEQCAEGQSCTGEGVCTETPGGDTGTPDVGVDVGDDASPDEDTSTPDSGRDDSGTSQPPVTSIGEFRGGGGCSQPAQRPNAPISAFGVLLILGLLGIRARKK